MPAVSFIPECYVDTNLVETLLAVDGCNHQKGCNTVVKLMQTKYTDRFAVGVIDNDKRRVDYVNEFTEIAHTKSLSLLKHKEKHHYLIMLTPAMDGFILRCAEELSVSMEEYGFPAELKNFTSVTKQVRTKKDPRFKNLFALLANSSEMKILKRWLKYLYKEEYNVMNEELINIMTSVLKK